jgi:hypothetical protein
MRNGSLVKVTQLGALEGPRRQRKRETVSNAIESAIERHLFT